MTGRETQMSEYLISPYSEKCNSSTELTKCGENEVEFPTDTAQSNRGNLGPESGDSPVSDAGSKCISLASDLHRHDLRHVNPT